ncbi:MAG TPA: MMPL family transporter [Micromonosporaceae bacterium]|nr:MMPL family transporter [Micromonosporaceae bacterium]
MAGDRRGEGVMARLGRWCFRRRWVVLALWLVATLAGVASAGPVFSRLASDNIPNHLESVAAWDVLNEGSDRGGQVVGLVDRLDPKGTPARDTIRRAADDLDGIPGTQSIAHPYLDPPLPAEYQPARYVGTDQRAVLLVVTLDRLEGDAHDTAVDQVTDRLHRLTGDLRAAGEAQARVRVGGDMVINNEVNAAVQEDLTRAEIISLPATLVLLVILFGGLVAASLPVLAAIVSAAAALIVLLGFSYFTDIDQNTVTVATLLGLGLSVDYGLLLVGRYREELRAGFDPETAVARAWATAGRTIAFSALTVGAAIAGLLAFDVAGLSALGSGGVAIALVAMIAALTFTAAMIGIGRRRIRPSKRARAAGAAGDEAEVGFFARLSRLVQRRPLLVALATTAMLLAAGLPLLSATVKLPRLEGVPRSIESVQVADDLAANFGQAYTPDLTVVARTDTASLDTWAGRWRTDPAVASVQPATSRTAGVSSVRITLRGEGQDDAAQALVHRLRADRPQAERSWVTGDAAVLVDLVDLILDDLPLAITVTMISMFLLLFAMTGSVVVPIKAILANVVSLGASFGVLVAVFQYGYGENLLQTLTIGGLSPFVMVIVFAFAFGLSMDYEVFLLGRIKEYVERGEDTDTAVRRGLQHTGRIITSAALLMVIVFGCFAAGRIGTIEQVGLGLTVAVLIDATIVRCLLVPATMTLLGRWNWWAPAPLRRLHARIGLAEHRLPDTEPLPAQEEPAPAAAR